MTDEDLSIRNITNCRELNAKAAAMYALHGATAEDIAIAASYSALDLATIYKGGDPFAALEWMRTALDVHERSLMEQGHG